jgi:hypothetical protein
MRRFVVAVLGLIVSVAPAALGASARADTALHAGLNLRADSGAHPARVIAGLDTGPVDLSVTLDPMVVFDGQFDADLLTSWKLSDGGWGLLVGWRSTSIGILGGRQLQEKAVLGITAPLPQLGDLPVRTRWGFEAAAVIVKHGGGLPTDFISFAEGRDFVDLINFGMFITVEYTSAGH